MEMNTTEDAMMMHGSHGMTDHIFDVADATHKAIKNNIIRPRIKVY
jgi:hypothetical protein